MILTIQIQLTLKTRVFTLIEKLGHDRRRKQLGIMNFERPSVRDPRNDGIHVFFRGEFEHPMKFDWEWIVNTSSGPFFGFGCVGGFRRCIVTINGHGGGRIWMGAAGRERKIAIARGLDGVLGAGGQRMEHFVAFICDGWWC